MDSADRILKDAGWIPDSVQISSKKTLLKFYSVRFPSVNEPYRAFIAFRDSVLTVFSLLGKLGYPSREKDFRELLTYIEDLYGSPSDSTNLYGTHYYFWSEDSVKRQYMLHFDSSEHMLFFVTEVEPNATRTK